MEIIVIESAAFEKLKLELASIVKDSLNTYLKEEKRSVEDDWISLLEAKKLLPYSSKTKWQQLRDNGVIVFSKMNRKIMYSKKSLISFIEKNKID